MKGLFKGVMIIFILSFIVIYPNGYRRQKTELLRSLDTSISVAYQTPFQDKMNSKNDFTKAEMNHILKNRIESESVAGNRLLYKEAGEWPNRGPWMNIRNYFSVLIEKAITYQQAYINHRLSEALFFY